jgi:DNA-binding TFAR19-related protein (PDSD5 family)
MVQITNEAKLKKLLKAVVVEVLEERNDLVRDALAEAVEDAGMIQAIQEGSRSAPIGRDTVFRILRKRR